MVHLQAPPPALCHTLCSMQRIPGEGVARGGTGRGQRREGPENGFYTCTRALNYHGVSIMHTCPIHKHVQGLSFMEESVPNILIAVFS